MNVDIKKQEINEIENNSVIIFDKGIPGFRELSKFVLAPVEENDLFMILQSVEDADIGLLVINPFQFKEDYEINIPDNVVKELDIKSEKDILLYSVVTLNNDPKKITANLMAPIIINVNNNRGKQLILENSGYKIKEPIL